MQTPLLTFGGYRWGSKGLPHLVPLGGELLGEAARLEVAELDGVPHGNVFLALDEDLLCSVGVRNRVRW